MATNAGFTLRHLEALQGRGGDSVQLESLQVFTREQLLTKSHVALLLSENESPEYILKFF